MHIAQGLMHWRIARILDWLGAKPQISSNDFIINFQKEKLFTGQRMTAIRILLKGRTKLQVEKFYKYIKIGRCDEQIRAIQTNYRRVLGAKSPALGNFL